MTIDPLSLEESIHQWQVARLAARNTCRSKEVELHEIARRRIGAMSLRALVRGTSFAREQLERAILDEIEATERRLAGALETALGQDGTGSAALTTHAGWNWRDLQKLAVGGGGAAAAVTVATRTAPGFLGMIGIGAASTVVSPIAATFGLVAFAWSAASVAGDKRQAYLGLVQDAITRRLVTRNGTETSVLSRSLARIDAAYQLPKE